MRTIARERELVFLEKVEYLPKIRTRVCEVELLEMTTRKVTKTRGSFPNDEALLKLLYLTLMNIAKNWTMSVQNWQAALNRFAISHEDRLPLPR